jgi:hypothetical protein
MSNDVRRNAFLLMVAALREYPEMPLLALAVCYGFWMANGSSKMEEHGVGSKWECTVESVHGLRRR